MNLHTFGLNIDTVYSVIDKLILLENIKINLLIGKINTVVGHYGQGKSLFFSILTGNLYSTVMIANSSQIIIDGEIFSYSEYKYILKRLNFFYINQNFLSILDKDLLVEEQINFFNSKINKKFLNKMLFRLNLNNSILKKKISSLSGGQMQRLIFLLPFIMPSLPNFLVLDEVFSALDWETEKQLWLILKDYCILFNITILLTSHNLFLASLFSDNIFIIKNKTIVNFKNS